MNPAYAFLAKKYARAFIAVNEKPLDEHDLTYLGELKNMLESHHEILLFFNLPLMGSEVTTRVIDRMLKEIHAAQVLKKLMVMLVHSRRAELIPAVFSYIISLYRERANTVSFSITTSHQLDEKAVKELVDFLAHSTNKKISYDYAVDKNLIAGMRLQSDTLLWEHSIKKQLDAFKRSLVDQGVVWN